MARSHTPSPPSSRWSSSWTPQLVSLIKHFELELTGSINDIRVDDGAHRGEEDIGRLAIQSRCASRLSALGAVYLAVA